MSKVFLLLVPGSSPPFPSGWFLVGPPGFGVLVLVGLVVVSGVCLVSSLPVEVMGVSLLWFPFFPFSLSPCPLVLGL